MDRATLICSVNRGLWQQVGPALRAVIARHESETIRLRFFIDGEPSDDDRESASGTAAEVIADFPWLDLDDEVLRLDSPQPIPFGDGWLTIFARREPT